MSSQARQAQAAFNSSVFEHAHFLINHRLYQLEGCGLLPKDPNGSLPLFIFSEKLSAYDYRLSSVESGRKLALLVIEDALRRINRDDSLRSYVLNFPLSEEDLSITIHFYTSAESNEVVRAPLLALISIEEGSIRYYTWSEKEGYSLKGDEKIIDAYNISCL